MRTFRACLMYLTPLRRTSCHDFFSASLLCHEKQRIVLSVGPMNYPPAENCRDFLAILAGDVEFVAVAPVALAGFMLPHDVRHVFRWKNRVGSMALQFPALVPSQADQRLVREDDTKLVINDDHSLVELFEDALHRPEPIRRLDVFIAHGFCNLCR